MDVDEFVEAVDAGRRRAARRSTPRWSPSSSPAAREDGPLSELTPRELEVLGLMAEGRSNAGDRARRWC